MEQTTNPSPPYPLSVTRSIHLAKDFMCSHLQDHLKLKALAKQSGTNECTLKKCFKVIFKISVYQYLLKQRMENALWLIQETDLKEAVIARQCGFETLSGFITTFIKYYGERPGHLRKISNYLK